MSQEGPTTEEEIESIVSRITTESRTRRPRRVTLLDEPEDEQKDADLLLEKSRE
jgi:hypothetical protein